MGSNAPSLTSIPGLRTFAVPGTRGHDVVYGLAAGGGVVYLAVSNEFTPGECAYISAFDPHTETFRTVIDIASATGYRPESGKMPHSKVHLSLNATPQGRVFAATHFTAPAIGQTSFNLLSACRGLFEGSYLLEYDPDRDRVVSYGCLLPGEGCRVSALDPVRECVYLVSYPRNHLFRFHYPTLTLNDLGRMGQENPFGLEVAPGGDVYTTDDQGRFLRRSGSTGEIEELDLFVPLKPGRRRRQGNYARRTAPGMDGSIYGAGNKGVRLFRLLPGAQGVVDYGPVLGREARTDYEFARLPPVKALVQTGTDTLYLAMGGDGIYADEFQVPSLVCYDLARLEAHEAGRFVDPEGVPAWIPQCAVYLAEQRLLCFGMQHAVVSLSLWCVSPNDSARAQPVGRWIEEQQKKVTRIPFGTSVEGSDRMPFAPPRRLSMTELGWRGEGLTIPPGECAIADLLLAGETLYGVTAGRRPHLFRYSPGYQNRFLENWDSHVCDLGAFSDAPAAVARVLGRPGGSALLLFAEGEDGVRAAAYDIRAERGAWRPHYHSIPHWPPYFAAGAPFEAAGCFGPRGFSAASAVFDPASGSVWSLDLEGALRGFGPGGEPRGFLDGLRWAPLSLALAGEQRLFAVAREGRPALVDLRLLRAEFYRAEAAPNEWSCRPAAGADRIALGARDGSVHLWDLARDRWLDPIPLPCAGRVRALAFAPGGALYGFNGDPDAIGEAFAVPFPETAARRIGVLQVNGDPRYWMCHRSDAVCAGPGGEIFFGESDRISHLFTYCP